MQGKPFVTARKDRGLCAALMRGRERCRGKRLAGAAVPPARRLSRVRLPGGLEDFPSKFAQPGNLGRLLDQLRHMLGSQDVLANRHDAVPTSRKAGRVGCSSNKPTTFGIASGGTTGASISRVATGTPNFMRA